MAVTEELFKARFRERFKTIALSNKTLDALAAKVAPTLPDDTDEAGIDAHLDFLNGLHPDGAFLAMQKADDKTVNEKKKQEAPKSEAKPKEADQSKDDDTPSWARTLIEDNRLLKEKIQSIEQEKQHNTILQRAEKVLAEARPTFKKQALKSLPKTEEEFEAWEAEVKVDLTADLQESINTNLGTGATARGTQPVGGKKPSKEELAEIMKKMS